MTRLRRADCASPGLTRRRCGRGFIYVDAAGRRVDDRRQLSRIASLAIPPAWQQVWICPSANGHIQATGVDAKGRRQYLYHDVWRTQRDREKFDHMLDFARSLPAMRATLAEHLRRDDLGRDQILSCAAHLLDIGFFRIGSEGYAEENHTYGLATLRKRHVTIAGDRVTFDYVAKDSKRRIQSIVDPVVAAILMQLKSRRGGGPQLLAYRRPATTPGRAGQWVGVSSGDVNDHLRVVTGISCSAKDFRTWNATVIAAVALAVGSAAPSPTARKRWVGHAMTEVAHYLGNTAAVARSSYVDPRVVDSYLAGETIGRALSKLADPVHCQGGLCIQGPIERAVLRLLEDHAVPVAA